MRNSRSEILRSIWGSSDKNIFAVGDDGTILHYDGTFSDLTQSYWSYINISPTWDLNSVWGSSSTDIFAVGKGGGLQYDGDKWSEIEGIENNLLSAVWVHSASDAFAVGFNGSIFHYNGSTWSLMGSGTTQTLNGVWGSSDSDIFAVGDEGTILHYNGNNWSSMDSGTDKNLNGVWGWGSPATDVFAVGGEGTILHYEETAPVTTSTIPETTTTTAEEEKPCPTEKIYGEYAKETEFLRYFRDHVLSKTPEGQELTRLYYEWSPAILRAMEEDEEFREAAKEMVDKILPLLKAE
jgi:hypothetical protein